MKKLTLESKIKDLYQNPVGHDALYKVLMQLGLSEKLITNAFVSNLKLKTVAKVTRKQLGDSFFDALLHLVNMEKDIPFVSKGEITKKMVERSSFLSNLPKKFL